MLQSRRRRVEAIVLASALGGLPSTTIALRNGPRAAIRSALAATRAIGVLVPPGRPGLVRGTLAHGGISAAMGEVLLRTVPGRRPVIEGATAGLAMGVINVAIIGRRFPAIRALPLVPQLADNIAFGLIVALAASRTVATRTSL